MTPFFAHMPNAVAGFIAMKARDESHARKIIPLTGDAIFSTEPNPAIKLYVRVYDTEALEHME